MTLPTVTLPFGPQPTPSPRHRLDAVGALRVWLWPIDKIDTAAEVTAVCEELKSCGITGIVPQQGSDAILWARTWGHLVQSQGLDVVIGLGRLSSARVNDAIFASKQGYALGPLFDQEAWKSVPDSDALCRDVLAQHPDAAEYAVDAMWPCLTTAGPHGGPTGHGPITKAWAPIAGLRAPQCYWESDTKAFAPDGWVADRLEWARQDYPREGGSPADRVRGSFQLYRHSVRSFVKLLLREKQTGSSWLWDWREADVSAKTALRIVHELSVRGFHGSDAVTRFQSASGLVADGLVGPATCAKLGVTVPAGVVWKKS